MVLEQPNGDEPLLERGVGEPHAGDHAHHAGSAAVRPRGKLAGDSPYPQGGSSDLLGGYTCADAARLAFRRLRERRGVAWGELGELDALGGTRPISWFGRPGRRRGGVRAAGSGAASLQEPQAEGEPRRKPAGGCAGCGDREPGLGARIRSRKVPAAYVSRGKCGSTASSWPRPRASSAFRESTFARSRSRRELLDRLTCLRNSCR